MKQLREILSKHAAAVTSGELPPDVPAEHEPDEGPGDPNCPACRGSGFIARRALPGDPRFGKAEPCACVLRETEAARRARLERLANLGALSRFRFETMLPGGPTGDDAAFRAAWEAARAFAAEPSGWLVLIGPSGSGKTHLAAAIVNERIRLGQPALFMVVPDLLDHLRASYGADEGELGYADLFEQLRNAPLLVLDDIDAAAGTPWAREKLFQLVNARYLGERPTVFTSTADLDALEQRLATRLGNPQLARVVRLGGRTVAYRQVGGMTLERLRAMQFRTFDARPAGLRPEERETVEAAYRAALAYADAPQGWFVLQGTNGCGKTHLAAAIANRVLDRGGDVFFAVVPDLLDHLRSSFAPGNESAYDELFEQVRSAGLLVLDDLGAHVSSPWAQEKLYQLVNFRTVAALPTVVTTDQSFEALQSTHPRIAARIFDPHAGTAVVILAPHYRLGRAAAPPQIPRRPRR
jgi:DNA replication protein DnaC